MRAIRFACLLLALPVLHAEPKRSLLDADPDVVYLDAHFQRPLRLWIIKAAPIYSDKQGQRKLGTVLPDQEVEIQAITERAYRVSARTGGNKTIGWVGSGAFASKEDPDVSKNLTLFYQRQLEVERLIAEKRAAIGMTMDEVSRALGDPTKKKVRQTAEGRSGQWEFIDYEEVKHYTYVRDPATGNVFRRLSHVTQEEKGRTTVEFENELVTAIEKSESEEGSGRVKIVVPPLVFGW
ncbi:hypothetical protein HNR46_000531 [Haloferula luteola]|uniref:Uncharacterized protein n=1 Tax=Haloferula luteola TaxID=595692 RepID=A0A840UVU6_9BACT|nr:hypothetical protein [Haloferula luteola]MBB5350307.1 hypothetical protein [Haloferula luteola]